MLDQSTWQSLINSPHNVAANHHRALKAMMEEYPYFQVPFLLMAVSSKDSAAIRAAAVRSAERKVLMQIINAEFDQNVSLPNIHDIDLDAGNTNAFEAFKNSDQPEETPIFSDPDYSTPVFQDDSTPGYLQEDPTETDNFWDRYREEPVPSTASLAEEETKQPPSETDQTQESTLYLNIQYEENATSNGIPPAHYDEVNQEIDTASDGFIQDMMQTLRDMQKARQDFMADKTYTVVDIEKDVQNDSGFIQQPNGGQTDDIAAVQDMPTLATHQPISYFDVFEKEAAVLEQSKQPSDSTLFELNNLLEDLNSNYADQRLVAEVVVAAYQKKIIDKVIENNPFNKIRNPPPTEDDNAASIALELYENSVTVNPKTATENLAKLHIQQKKYQKAIMIYKQLALKYPEKSHYFADQIKELERKL